MRRRTASGFWSVDATMGLVLISILSLAVAAVISRHNRAAGTFAESRRLVRTAENALVAMNSGTDPFAEAKSEHIAVSITAVPIDSPPGMKWVHVTATGPSGRQRELYGLVPQAIPTPEDPSTTTSPASSTTQSQIGS